MEWGGSGGRRIVNDSSTCGMSNIVVCLLRGSGTFTSISASLSGSSKSGVEVHDEGRFALAAATENL